MPLHDSARWKLLCERDSPMTITHTPVEQNTHLVRELGVRSEGNLELDLRWYNME